MPALISDNNYPAASTTAKLPARPRVRMEHAWLPYLLLAASLCFLQVSHLLVQLHDQQLVVHRLLLQGHILLLPRVHTGREQGTSR